MENKITFKSVEDFLEQVGRLTFQNETGFSTQIVWRAKTTRTFPAHWLWKVRDFCEARNIATPEHLFAGHPDAPKDERGTA